MHLIEDGEAQAALDDALEKWEGTRVAWECATWVILRDQNVGLALSDDGRIRVFTYESARSVKHPTTTIIYEVGRHETIIRAAKFTEAQYGTAGRA